MNNCPFCGSPVKLCTGEREYKCGTKKDMNGNYEKSWACFKILLLTKQLEFVFDESQCGCLGSIEDFKKDFEEKVIMRGLQSKDI